MTNKKTNWRDLVLIAILAVTVVTGGVGIVNFFDVPAEEAVARSASSSEVHFPQGGSEMHVASGGKIEVESGGELEMQSGSTLDIQAGAGAAFDTLVVSAATAVGTATPALVVNNDGVSNGLEVRDSSTPVFTVEDGGNFVSSAGGGNIAVATAQATGVPGLVVNSDGVNNIVSFQDGSTEAFVVEDGGNFAASFGGAVVAPTAQATAVPALSVNNLGVSKSFEVSDTGSPSFSILDGGGVVQPINIEHLGSGETHLTLAIAFSTDFDNTGGTGTLATVTDGEIWLVRRIVVNVTTNFDATGDDVTLDVGDGNDADGFLDLDDAMLQAAAVDYTGAQAGWQGLDGAAPTGAYIIGGPQLYAPSGADETIDWLVAETSGTTIAAGVATIHLWYTRFQ